MSAGALPVAPSGDGEFSLDLENADLANVVRLFMEDGLSANYILDPAVTGSVTLRTNRPLTTEQLLPTLEEILRLNDAAMVLQDGTYRILPRAQAGQAAPLLSARSIQQRGLVTTVTPLRFVTAEDVAEVLEGFAPVAGSIRLDRSRNLVFVIGSTAEQRTIQNVLATLDVDFFAGRSFALRPLREADAAELVDELSALYATPSGALNPAIRFIPIDRIDSVLIIADQPGLIDEALALTRSLDQGLSNTERLHVYPVTNRRASDLAAILGEIFDAEIAGASNVPSDLAPGLTPDEGFADADGTVEARLEPSGVAALDDRAFGVSSGDGFGGGNSGVKRIVADESSNSLVALATGDGAKALESALRRLDVQPLQVMIEATLVEVVLNDTLEFGVRWFLQQGNFSFGFNDVIGTAVGSFLPGFNAQFANNDATVTISALDAVTDVRILSSPTLMVLDNQTARLQVGDQVPITTRAAQSTDDPDAPVVAETEYRDTGVILEIRPTVNAGGLVVLEIRQEVSDVQETAGDVNPTFAQRVVESSVAVQSGQTVAIAGLIEEASEFGRDGIPVLSRIPILGAAFGTTIEDGGRSELLVLIRPIVIRDQSDAQAATLELQRKLANIVPQRASTGDAATAR